MNLHNFEELSPGPLVERLTRKKMDPIEKLLATCDQLMEQIEEAKDPDDPKALFRVVLKQVEGFLEPANELAPDTIDYCIQLCCTILEQEAQKLVSDRLFLSELLELLLRHGSSALYRTFPTCLIQYIDILLSLLEGEEQLAGERQKLDSFLISLYDSLCEEDGKNDLALLVLKKRFQLWYPHDIQRAESLLLDHGDAKRLISFALSPLKKPVETLRFTESLLASGRFDKDVTRTILEARCDAAHMAGQVWIQKECALKLLYLGDYTYYQVLKGLCTQEEFDTLVVTIIEKLKGSEVSYLYHKVLADRRMYPELLEHIKGNLHLLHRYTELLAPHYPQEVYELYERQIRLRASKVRDRTDLSNLMWLLQLLRRHGGELHAARMEQEIRQQYGDRWPFA